MCLFVNPPEFFHGVVRVHLGGCKAAVTEEIFDSINFSAPVEEVRGIGVTQNVRTFSL